MYDAFMKMYIKPGMKGVLLGLPADLDAGDLQENSIVIVASGSNLDFGLLFARSMDDLIRLFPGFVQQIKPGGLVWVAYPKGTSGVKTDINRDRAAAEMLKTGWQGVTMIAIDPVWSAMRFRPAVK